MNQYEVINLSIGINALRLRNEYEQVTNQVGYAILKNIEDMTFEPFEIYIIAKSWCHLL